MPAQLKMPGFNVPLNTRPEIKIFAHLGRRQFGFPNALDWDHLADGRLDHLVTRREILMMRAMNIITDKSEWDGTIFDSQITHSKWREEIEQVGEEISPKMMSWIIDELQWKAKVLKETGYVCAFDPGVVKSDTVISKELREALKHAVRPLENELDDKQDYQPDSDQTVVDLVHPSHYPVIYGHTRVLPHRTIGLGDCLDSAGHGEVIPVPSEEEATIRKYAFGNWNPEQRLSQKFQWLPCDIELTDSGCRFVSYINNVHPVKDRELYETIEKILAQAIPLWNRTLTGKGYNESRIKYENVEFGEHSEPMPVEPQDASEDGDEESEGSIDIENTDDEEEEYEEEEYQKRLNAWYDSRPILQPEPGDFEVPEEADRVDLREHYPDQKLQVVVKLTTIQLTPDDPEYEGGSWYIEGTLNERICATAEYYYDCKNITENNLAFRTHGMIRNSMDIQHEKGEHGFLHPIFGFDEGVGGRMQCQITQELGNVACREGRLLTFPNSLQRRVSPFSLADRLRPGHCKLLSLFLVDPHRRIISSANVPPQRDDWTREKRELVNHMLSERLPVELQQMIKGDVPGRMMSMEEAKEWRLALIEERDSQSYKDNWKFEVGKHNLWD